MTFHDWLKQARNDPAKMAYLDGIAREAELAREIEEDAAWDEYAEKNKK